MNLDSIRNPALPYWMIPNFNRYWNVFDEVHPRHSWLSSMLLIDRPKLGLIRMSLELAGCVI